jgi:hypothetical protein
MPTINPWIGVSLVTIGVAATLIFALLHMPDSAAFASIISIGLLVVQGSSHASSVRENGMLKSQLRQNSAKKSPDEVRR